MALRTGHKNPFTLYVQEGEEPSDDDAPLGFVSDDGYAQEIVSRFNEHADLYQRVLRLEAESQRLERLAEAYRQEIQRLQAVKEPVVMSDGDKLNTEAAFQRGVEHARTNMGVSKYSANRSGIMLIGEAASALSDAQRFLDSAVKELSTDDEATDRVADDDPTPEGWATCGRCLDRGPKNTPCQRCNP